MLFPVQTGNATHACTAVDIILTVDTIEVDVCKLHEWSLLRARLLRQLCRVAGGQDSTREHHNEVSGFNEFRAIRVLEGIDHASPGGPI